MSVKIKEKDERKPRCLARLTDKEHSVIVAASKRSGCKSIREWLLQLASDCQEASGTIRKGKK